MENKVTLKYVIENKAFDKGIKYITNTYKKHASTITNESKKITSVTSNTTSTLSNLYKKASSSIGNSLKNITSNVIKNNTGLHSSYSSVSSQVRKHMATMSNYIKNFSIKHKNSISNVIKNTGDYGNKVRQLGPVVSKSFGSAVKSVVNFKNKFIGALKSAVSSQGAFAKSIASSNGGIRNTYLKVISAIYLVRKATQVFTSLIKLHSDEIESLNKLSVGYGKVTDTMRNFGDVASLSFGYSRQEAYDMMGTIALLGDTAGLTSTQIDEMSVGFTSLASDLASIHNLEPSAVFNNLTSALTGQSRAMKKYGIDVTVTAMQQYMLENGIQGVWRELSQGEKYWIMYNKIMEDSQTIMGDYERTQFELANGMRTFKAILKDIGSTVGGSLYNPVAKTVAVFVGFAGAIKVTLDVMQDMKDGTAEVGKSFNELARDMAPDRYEPFLGVAKGIVDTLIIIGNVIKGVVSGIVNFAKENPKLTKTILAIVGALAGLKISLMIISGIMSSLIVTVGWLISPFTTLMSSIGTVGAGTLSVFTALGGLSFGAISDVAPAVSDVGTSMSGVTSKLTPLLNILGAITVASLTLSSAFTGGILGMTITFSTLSGALQNIDIIMSEFKESFNNAFDTERVALINGYINNIKESISTMVGAFKEGNFAEGFGEIANIGSNLKNVIVEFTKGLFETINGMNWDNIFEKVKSSAINVFNSIVSSIGEMSKRLGNIDFSSIGGNISSFMSTALSTVINLITSFDFAGFFGNIAEFLGEALNGVIEFIIGFLTETDWATLMSGWISAVFDMLIEAILGIFDLILNIDWINVFMLIIEAIKTMFEILWGIIVGIVVGVDWLSLGLGILKFLVEALSSIGSAIWNFIVETDWLDLGLKVLNWLVSGLADIGSSIWNLIAETDWVDLGLKVLNWMLDSLSTIGKSIAEFITETDWVQLGLDILNFLLDSLGSLGSKLVDSIRNIDWGSVGSSIASSLNPVNWFSSPINPNIKPPNLIYPEGLNPIAPLYNGTNNYNNSTSNITQNYSYNISTNRNITTSTLRDLATYSKHDYRFK